MIPREGGTTRIIPCLAVAFGLAAALLFAGAGQSGTTMDALVAAVENGAEGDTG